MTLRTLLVGIALAAGGCLGDEPVEGWDGDGDGKADSAQSPVDLIQTNSPFYWAPSDYQGFQASAAMIGLPGGAAALPDTDAMTRRLQGWVDRIDAEVRRDVERSIGEPLVAPRPILKVLPSSNQFNAWVSPAVACTGVIPAGGAATPDTVTLLQSTTTTHGAAAACVRPSYPDVAAFRTFWDRHKPACKLGADLQVGGTGCEVYASANPAEVAFFSTSPFIHMTTDLIASVSEPAVVLVLAHELGHYYRSHTSEAAVQRYNFWYETEIDRKKVPVPSASATALQAAYAEIVNGPATVQAAVPGRYSPRLRSFLLTQIAPLLTERTEAGFVCATARDSLGPWVDALLNGYGVPTEAITPYLAFEQALAACAPRLDMGSGGSATSLSFGTVLMAVMDAKLPGATFPFRATLADVLGPLNSRAVRLDQKAAALLQKVRDNRIGLYTVEQEADNIALALATRIGIPAEDALDAWLEFSEAVAGIVPEAYRAQYAADAAACRAQLDAGFTTLEADGRRVATFVPIGNLGEPHHSECYRLFNLWREQRLRNYQVTEPATFEPGWDDVRAQAGALSAAAAIDGH